MKSQTKDLVAEFIDLRNQYKKDMESINYQTI
jgi:hypothetical protein